MKKGRWKWIVAIVVAILLLIVLIFPQTLGLAAKSGGGKCTDSDGGISTYQPGTCKDGTGSYVDSCKGNFNPNTGEGITEYYCQRNKCTMVAANCPPYKVCYKGGCYDPGTVPNNTNGS